MLIALLLFAGVSPALVAALLFLLAHRRRVTRRAGVFRCTVQEVSTGPASEPSRKSEVRSGHAEWVHDVLLVYVGLGRFRVLPMAAVGAVGRVELVRPAEAKRLGDESAGLAVRLDDDTVIRVIAPAPAASLLAGRWVSTVLPPVVRQATPAS